LYVDPNGSNDAADANYIGPDSAYAPQPGDLTKPWRTIGGAINWYLSNGFTGAHSGTPTVFVWPGDYTAETIPIEIPSNAEINIQISGGVKIPYSVSSNALFYFNGSNGVLNITGQDAGDPGRSSYPSSEFSGVNGSFVLMNSQTENAELNMDGISVTSNTTVLLLNPGTTGAGDCDIYVNNSKIDNYGNTATPALNLSGPLYVGIDNSSIINQFGDGDPAVGVINIGANGTRLSISDSIIWQKGVNSTNDTSAIAANIGSTTHNQADYYIVISGNTFYSDHVQNASVLYDYNGSSTGILAVHTNSNNVHNMIAPTSAGDGTFLLSGPGSLQLKYLHPPTW
jgi:hypothetical protein